MQKMEAKRIGELYQKRGSNDLMTLVAKVLKPPVKLCNVEMCWPEESEWDNFLREPELLLLLEVMMTVMSQKQTVPQAGSFVLYGQPEGEEAIRILSADLGGGVASVPNWDLSSRQTSRMIVMRAVNAVVHYAELGKFADSAPVFLPKLNSDDAYLESRIYEGAEESVLVFNTDLGRLIASYRDGSLSNGSWMLAVVAQTLAGLRPDDAMAQESAALVWNDLRPDPDDTTRPLMKAVEQMFRQETDPMLQEWQEWLQKMNP